MRTAIVLLLASSAVAYLAIPPGMVPGGASANDRVDAAAHQMRLAALARARVFASEEDHDNVAPLPDEIRCRFVNRPATGTTPKFDCMLENGERIRVRYGTSLERHAEVAATALLKALGFGADLVSMARLVICHGCPHWPYHSSLAAERLRLQTLFENHIDYENHSDFEWASVERRDRRHDLEFGEEEGWAFHDSSRVDPSVGGATRAEVDALRLMAMFLNHWDNKASNESLVCPSAAGCDHPLAIMQDVGSTFGPKKVNLGSWSETPVWKDAARCTLSMENLPYDGGTFGDVRISEEGRRLLAGRFDRLSAPQIRALFTNARFDDVDRWVAAFERRVDAIARRSPCPSTS